MGKHTGGTWTNRQAYSSGEPQGRVIQCGTEVLAEVAHLGNDRQEEYEANAMIMTAAPKLFRLLKEVHETLSLLLDSTPNVAIDILQNQGEKLEKHIQSAIAQIEKGA